MLYRNILQLYCTVPEELAKKRLKQSIRDAEKRSVLFNLDLGPVPTMNKETLSRKVTMALSDKAKGGAHD